MGLLSSKRVTSLLLSGAGVAVLAAAAAPGSASAACTTIRGQGGTLQAIAQSTWIGNITTCSGSITYVPSSSGAGLTAFGAGGATPTADAYITTDEAPTAAQITNIRSGAGGASVEVIPVAQAAVSVLVNLPANCAAASGVTRLWADNTALRNAYEGTAPSFSTLFPSGQLTGTGCSATPTAFARASTSGTTYIFKGYLLNGGAVADPSGAPNWRGAAVRATATGGGNLVDLVKANAGSIGYANLADSVARSVTGTVGASGTASWVELRNSTGVAGPQAFSGGQPISNCQNTSYANLPGATTNADWSAVIARAPSTTTTYPLCGLTYDVAYGDSYAGLSRAGGVTFTFDTGDTVRTFLQFATSVTGQALLNRNNYLGVSGAGLLTLAQNGARNIN